MPEIRIQRCLGRGGFGEVYKGVMSRGGGLEVDVAIKVLRADLEPSSQGVQRLRDEGRLLGRLTHPTILRVYDFVVVDGRAALVTEFVAGDDLARLLRDQEMPARAVFEVIAQVAAALDAAWSWPSVTDGKPLHLVHRDIKPDNIRIDPNGVVKLLDFGIAQAKTVQREAHTSVNVIMGSTQYLAPERLVQQEVGPESDVFALGCTMFETLTGEALFVRKSMRQMYLLMVEPARFDEFVADRCETMRDKLGSDGAIALVQAMTAYRKGDRPGAADVAARCDLISDAMPGPNLTQWCRSRRWPPARLSSGPLDGRVFETSASLAEAEIDTMDLKPLAGRVIETPPRAGPDDTTAPSEPDTERCGDDPEPAPVLEPMPRSSAELTAPGTEEESGAPTHPMGREELVDAKLLPDSFRVPQLLRQQVPALEPAPEPERRLIATEDLPEPVTTRIERVAEPDPDPPTVSIELPRAVWEPLAPDDNLTDRIPRRAEASGPRLEPDPPPDRRDEEVVQTERPESVIERPQDAREPTPPVVEEPEAPPAPAAQGVDEIPAHPLATQPPPKRRKKKPQPAAMNPMIAAASSFAGLAVGATVMVALLLLLWMVLA